MKKWVAGGLAVMAVGAGVAAWVMRNDGGKHAGKAVATVAVGTGAVTAAVAATGTVQPAAIRTLSFAVDARVKAVGVRAGSRVAKGAVLASVDDTDAVDAVNDAKESLSEAEDQLAAAKSAAATTSTTAAAALAATAEAAGAVATTAGARTEATTAGEAPTEATTARARTEATTARARTEAVAAREGRTEAVAAREGRTEAVAGQDARVRAVAAATPSPAGGGGAVGQGGGAAGGDAIYAAQKRVNEARNALAEARVALAGTTIKAPIAGTVMAVAGKVGTDVSKGATFVTLADTNAMRVWAAFPEADAGSLAVGQAAKVTLADRVGEEFAATVVQVDPVGVADSTLVTYGVGLVFAKQPAGLLAGQSAAVEVTTDWVAETLRVPSTAVHDDGGGKGAVQVAAAGARTVRRVGVGLRGDQYTQITSGLTAGELVVRSW